MDKKTEGAWIVHHSRKLHDVTGATKDYEQIEFAGRCGQLLSALASTNEVTLDNSRVMALARASGISTRLELPAILDELDRQRLIDKGDSGIAVLGLTTSETLEHTATILEEAEPTKWERASIELAETCSDLPVVKEQAAEYIGDQFGLATNESNDILTQFEHIGFIDHEASGSNVLYFNGNLFRREDMHKINGVLSSLTPDDESRVRELSDLLNRQGCVSQSRAKRMAGAALYGKLTSIGFLDENTIGNESGTFTFVTRPSAFSKFTNTHADDAFDLAKAFVTSITYGMTASTSGRGRITMVEALMRKLINGQEVGPATAIGQDYKVLELKGVISLRPASLGRYYMRLLKRDVGTLALRVITQGDVSAETSLELPAVSATQYTGPEQNRTVLRKRQTEPLRRGVAGLLSDLRKGNLR